MYKSDFKNKFPGELDTPHNNTTNKVPPVHHEVGARDLVPKLLVRLGEET